jgi:hypothetical protein
MRFAMLKLNFKVNLHLQNVDSTSVMVGRYANRDILNQD